MGELLNCPLCGKAAKLIDDTQCFWVECQNTASCEARGGIFVGRDLAIKNWNTRSGSQGVVDDGALERACSAYDPMWDCRLMVEKQTIRERMRAALLAAMGGRGEEWIVTKDRKPNDCVEVDAIWWGGDRKMAYRRNGVWWYYGQMGIKEASVPPNFWRPLPPPPATISEERP